MTIQTERLVLRPLGTECLETQHRFASDLENTRYMVHLPNGSKAETLAFLQQVERQWQEEQPAGYEFAIWLEGAHIGAVSVYRQEDGETGELGWILDKRYWGRGYALEAARGLAQLSVRELGFKRFIAHCDSENTGSYRVMEKLGMKRTGCHPGRKNRASDEERSEYTYEMCGAFFAAPTRNGAMICACDGPVLIRTMCDSDPDIISREERAQGWIHATAEKYSLRLTDLAEGRCIPLVAEYEGSVAGYINLYPDALVDAEENLRGCNIVDFGVLAKFRNRGVGTKLMDAAEKIAAGYGDTVYIGVGLHSGYGSAQRMYVKRGYVPDGKGVWYDKTRCEPYQPYCNDDDLHLHLSKRLRTPENG